MKIEKETLRRYRAQLKTLGGGGLLITQQQQVVEFALELIDAADGGPDIAKLRQELAQEENNLKLILTDVRDALPTPHNYMIPGVEKARYLIATALQYLRSSKTKDFQSWKDYRAMVDEEFNSV